MLHSRSPSQIVYQVPTPATLGGTELAPSTAKMHATEGKTAITGEHRDQKQHGVRVQGDTLFLGSSWVLVPVPPRNMYSSVLRDESRCLGLHCRHTRVEVPLYGQLARNTPGTPLSVQSRILTHLDLCLQEDLIKLGVFVARDICLFFLCLVIQQVGELAVFLLIVP